MRSAGQWLPSLGVLAVVFIPCQIRAEEDANLPLPHWSPMELDAMRATPSLPPLLGDLLGEMDEADAAAATRPLLLGQSEENIGDSPEKVQPSADLSRFLPQSLLKPQHSHPAQQTPPSPIASLTEVPPEFLRDCEDKEPTTHLIDPNHELTETAVEDFGRFLTFHASDSRIPLNLVILGRSQKLPEGASLAAFAAGGVARGSAALVVCPYGEPWRTRFFVSQPIRDTVPPAYLNGLLESCIRDAQRATDPDEQLHRLLVQLSIRLFWVQRMLSPAPNTSSPPQIAAPEIRAPALQEVTPLASPPYHGQQFGFSPLGIALVLLLSLLFYAGWRWHRYKMRHYQWLLPDLAGPATPRLGGPHCGGGVAIRFR